MEIGQEVFYTRSLFTRGKIVRMDGDSIHVVTDNSVAPRQLWYAPTMLKTKSDALWECESEIEYWTRCAEKLRAEMDKETQAKYAKSHYELNYAQAEELLKQLDAVPF